MALIVILIFVMLTTLFAVGAVHRLQQRQRQRRLEQRRLRTRVEELTDVVNCLEQTIPNRNIIKHINDMIIGFQHQILALEDNNRERIEAAILKSERYSEELLSTKIRPHVSYPRDSDAQIAKTQLHINEAISLLLELAANGSLDDVELTSFQAELRWASLMVSVMSYIAQGDKSFSISDRLAFYRKAQHLLLESTIKDPRRLQMIKELSEMIDGDRTELSAELRGALPQA